MTGSAVVAYEAASLNDRREYAKTLAAAGDLIPKGLWNPATNVNGVLVPSAPSPGKVLLVIETGSMLGLHPAAALQSINVVEGRATLSAQLIAALIRKAGHRLTIEKKGTVAGGDYAVTVTGVRADSGDEYTSTWDFHRAIRAGLVDSYKRNDAGVWEVRARSDKGKAKPWEAYAEVMPVWRAISEVSREGFSDVTYGLYSNEELTDGGPSLPVAGDPAPTAEPTEDWPALVAAAATREELSAIWERAQSKGEANDKLRAACMARAGVLAREANTEDAQIVTDESTETPDAEPAAPAPAAAAAPGEESEAEYEARVAAEYEAAVARGEV